MFIYKIHAVGELDALIKCHPEHGVPGVWRYFKKMCCHYCNIQTMHCCTIYSSAILACHSMMN